MGAMLSLPMVAAQMACCCGTAACNLCCASCPNCRNSVAARLMYGIMLIIGAVASLILLSPGLKHALVKIPYLCKHNSSSDFIPIPSPGGLDLDCEELVGYAAVYRVAFGFVAFFAFMTLLMLGVQSSRDPRALIQRGFWFFKYVMVIGAIVGAFFIPQSGFASAWSIIGVVGSCLFIIIQAVLLIDFAHTLAKSWLTKVEEDGASAYRVLMALTTIALFGISIAAIVLMYIFYGYSGCPLQQFFISFILILCVIQSAIAILPAIQNRLPHSGLLQSSVVSVYAVYLAWNAVATWPYNKCQLGYNPNIDDGSADKKWNAVITVPIIVALIVWMLTLIYSCVRSVERSQVPRSTVPGVDRDGADGAAALSAPEPADPEAERHHTWDDEDNGVSYSYSFSHFMYMLAALYMMMTITQWYSPNSSSGGDGNVYEGNTSATWVHFPIACAVCGLYIWTLVAPILFPDRDFA